MDTDDLSQETFEIIKKAGVVNEYLRLELGVMARNYKNENDYLNGVKKHMKDTLKNPARMEFEWLLEPSDFDETAERIIELLSFTDSVIEIPFESRSFIEW